ncbi:MAG: thiamine pyrophosphate-dependent dehydrogenase E1 component subunit alpha, partial [Bacillota bacterium]
MDLSEATKLYRMMRLIRRFEERVLEAFIQGKVAGSMFHLCVGQEAVAAGACSRLNPDDYIVSHHRGHGHMLAKGGDPKRMMAEIFGKETGYCKGKGGSMHIADRSLGHLGANGVVGGGLPIATGAALACSLLGTKRVVVCFFGDGAVNEGVFHESLNVASIWKLPVVYVCENNLYAL